MRLRSRAASLSVVLALILGTLLALDLGSSDRDAPRSPTEIFAGITYGRERLDPTEEGSGILHWARIDLSAPGIGLYVTPIDPGALARGRQYRLRWIASVVEDEHLALAINASQFAAGPRWKELLPGSLANGVESVVANHVLSHLWPDTYLLWFDDQLTPTLEQFKPPPAVALRRAKWGIGGQGVGLWDGSVGPHSGVHPDSRTAVAIDLARRLLFLAVGENISPRLILQKLTGLGALEGMLLDGGHSSTMAIGAGAHGLGAGAVYGGWWPVATQFGVRAKPL
jgi:hypothetical protein